MALCHRPEFEALELENEAKRFEGTDFRDAYLWPYINEEDLCRSRSLLLLMSTRGRCHPSELAISEHKAHHWGRNAYIFGFATSNGFGDHRMDLTSRGGDNSYGRLWNRNNDPAHFSTLDHWSHQYSFPGFLILEAQERVLSFLVKCAKLILHDLTGAAVLQAPIQPGGNLLKAEVGHASLATIAAEAPYQKPNDLDFARIASLLAAKYDQVSDHLWSLREDPGYFEAHILDSKEHRMELIPDIRGHVHPGCSIEHEDEFWAQVVAENISKAYAQCGIFGDLLSQADALSKLQMLYADAISTSDFPEPYTAAILLFQLSLKSVVWSSIEELRPTFHASPQMRHHFIRKEQTDPTAKPTVVRTKTSFDKDPLRTRTYWLLTRLWTGNRSEDELLEMLGTADVIDELQRLLDMEAAKASVSSYIVSVVGDMAFASECLNQLDSYQPWTRTQGNIPRTQRELAGQEFYERATSWKHVHLAISGSKGDLGDLAKPTNGKFAYPIAKRRTRENIESMRHAESNLDMLWKKVDDSIMTHAGELACAAVNRLQDRALQRTSEWTEPKKESVQPVIEELYIPFSQLHFDDPKVMYPTSFENSKRQPKQEIKTRRAWNLEAPAEPVAQVLEPEPAIQFSLNARALRVFKTLFFVPSTTSTPGEVAWADFLYAMVAVGFVPQKLYGSVWQFGPDPSKLAVERSIQFHEPHGANIKIPYQIARRHGRRLNRAYGWDGSSFTLEEKTKQ